MDRSIKTDNGGFTLIEMLLCLTIFAVVAAAAFGFMLTGAYSFNTVSDDVNLQLDSDVAMNHISQYMRNCNAGIAFSDNTLYLIGRDPEPSSGGSETYTAYIFQLKSDNGIYFTSAPAVPLSDDVFSCYFSAEDLLIRNAGDFRVTYLVNSDGSAAVGAKVEALFTRGGKGLPAYRTVALRNAPKIVTVS